MAADKWIMRNDVVLGENNKELQAVHFGDHPPEFEETSGLKELVSPSKRVLVDIGASVGEYTKAFLDARPDCKVISVDADRERFDQLEANVRVWRSELGGDHTGEHVGVWGALTDTMGEMSFNVTENGTSGSLAPTPLAKNWKTVKVPAYKLDDIVAERDHVFIKIDIEGGEYSCLLGASEILAGADNDFQVELHYWGDVTKGTSVRDVLSLFSKNGYGVKKYYRHYFFSKSIERSRLKNALIGLQYNLYPVKHALENGALRSVLRPFFNILRGIYRKI